MPDKTYTLHVLSHSHLDREWYQEFQGFRQRMVFQMDSMLDLLEQREDFEYFHLDGQTICLEDYLQIRPENRERLTRLMREGKVLIGPWFVMPDELLLSGESMVRNLMLGHKICGEFGVEPMPIGYVTDIFGHCSQFPQIVRGFGIDTVFLHRGTTNTDGASEMMWEGADGSEVLIIKAYPHTGYNDFLAYRQADDATLLEYEEKKHAYAATHVLFALDGNDHMPAWPKTPEYIDNWNRVFKDTHCIHSSLVTYLQELKAELGDLSQRDLVRYRGELRHTMKASGMYAELMQGTASSRVPLKQHNDKLEYLLPRCAEWLHAWSVALGGDCQKPFLDLAWKYLITNHPHDSIVGCSVDQVHRDMIYRFDQARCLAVNSIGESMHAIGDRLDTASLGESDAVVTVFSPSAEESAPVSEFSFDMLSRVLEEKRKEGMVPALIDDSGELAHFEVLRTDLDMWPSPLVKKYRGETPCYMPVENSHQPHHRFHVAVAGSVPALGYRSWRIRYLPKRVVRSASLPQGIEPVAVGERSIENEYLRLEVRGDGLVDLYDKSTATWFRNLHEFEDCGDAGQGWDHYYPATDRVVLGSDAGVKSNVRVRIKQTGGLHASAEVSFSIRVPKSLSKDRKGRSKGTVAVPIRIVFSLSAGSRRIDCTTTVHNTAKCHRLRALFPTSREAKTWFGDSAFDLVERNIRLPDTTGWGEQAREETPIKNIAAVQDSSAGFAVITKGVCEACVQDVPARTLALTLFRGFEQQIGDGWTQDSNVIGDIVLEYALVPFTPQPDAAPTQLFAEVERYKLPCISLTSRAHVGDLPPASQYVEVPKGLVISTIKMAEDRESIVLRVFNPSPESISGEIALHVPIQQACECDMLERDTRALRVDDGGIRVTVGAKKAVSLRVR